ncbi:MAG: LAGLIDADG family homing endonuclease [Candidatus Berkelbacteria bacterium]|nr:LAGLIDADG family homing endonuclease [Candidatus Berkelbacteria bacterium]
MSVLGKLPGDYVAGFVDGEGCFYLTYRSDTRHNRPGSPKYFRWTPYFAILLREDDLPILEEIRNSLDCGRIYHMNGGQVSYAIQNLNDLYEKVVPFFTENRLRAKKRIDFELWCQALRIVYKNKENKRSCSLEDNQRLAFLRQKMKEHKAIGTKEYKNNPSVSVKL